MDHLFSPANDDSNGQNGSGLAAASPAANGMPPLPMFQRSVSAAEDSSSAQQLLRLRVGGLDGGYFSSSSSSSSTTASAGHSPSYSSSLVDFELDTTESSDGGHLVRLSQQLQQLQQLQSSTAQQQVTQAPGRLPVFSTMSK